MGRNQKKTKRGEINGRNKNDNGDVSASTN